MPVCLRQTGRPGSKKQGTEVQLSQNPQVLDAVVRMVIPMRREFGCALDVQVFMRDAVYARMVLRQARTSQVQRLRDYAEVVQRNLGTAETQPALPARRSVKTAMDGVARAR